MIVHLFNSSSVSGPERLVLPALAAYPNQFLIVNLREERIDRLQESDPLKEFSQSLNLRYISVPVKSRWDRSAIHALQQLLDRLTPDLVHAHALKASVYLQRASRLATAHRYPIVSTHHGVHGLPDWKTRLYERLYRKYFLKFFDRVLAVSTADYEFLLNSGVDKNRLRRHINGVDARYVAVADRASEAQKIRALWLPMEADRERLFLFGMIGRLSAEKDHARLLDVLSCLNQRPENRDWKCLIFGIGDLQDKLRQQADRLSLAKRVVWMGYRKDMANEIAGLDLVLSFSKAEGLPINLIEAGWAGTPAMSTYVGGVKDLIPDDSYGVRIPPDEPPLESARRMQTLFSDDGRAQLQAKGKRFQERILNDFTRQKWLACLQAIYAELNVNVCT